MKLPLLLCLVIVLSFCCAVRSGSTAAGVSHPKAAVYTEQGLCDQTMCSIVCTSLGLPKATCREDVCECSYGENCSAMVNVTCKAACYLLKLNGECDKNGMCNCEAELEVCAPWDCYEQCLDDEGAVECKAAGGIVTPIACLKYGPIKTCECLCSRPEFKGLLTSKNRFIGFQSEEFRYSVVVQ